jgi:hypothetical protein
MGARGLMSVLSRVKRWFVGSPERDDAEPASEPLSRHERREAGRERHHRTGEPAWQAHDRVGQPGGEAANPDAAPEILGGG